ncbi:MAG TPA: formyltransferase family protein [Terriglobales bacterium]|nr:formyltransferase family protein [Terriglobales bacterium]
MRTFLICHQEEVLNREVLPRWLASFSELGGIVVLRETGKQRRRRIQREFARVGALRFLDVVAFRLYYRLFQGAADRRWQMEKAAELCQRYPGVPATTPVLVSPSPNSPQVRDFIHHACPDLMIARCKVILKESIFSIPPEGTFVLHPGICPEYRNAHGCFWALANRDFARVGMTLLRIDRGVDTGPIFGYYHCAYDERRESHIVIQDRMVFDNLEVLRQRLEAIRKGQAVPLDVSGRSSAAWGQPWLTKYVAWKRAANRA